MKRKFNIYVIALLCIAMTGCNDTLVELVPENNQQTSQEYHSIPLEDALAQLNDFLVALEKPTRSGEVRRIGNVEVLRSKNLATRSGSSNLNNADSLIYIVNFEDNQGFAYLAADDRISAPVIYVADSGNASTNGFGQPLIIGDSRPLYTGYPLNGSGTFYDNSFSEGELFMNPNTFNLYNETANDCVAGDFFLNGDAEYQEMISQINDLVLNFVDEEIDTGNNSGSIYQEIEFEHGDSEDLADEIKIIRYTSRDTIVDNLLTFAKSWRQGDPMNTQCPMVKKYLILGAERRAYVGCVPLAIAKIITYHQHPANFVINGISINWYMLKNWGVSLGSHNAATLLKYIGDVCGSLYFYEGTFTLPSAAASFLSNRGYTGVNYRNYDHNVVKNMLDNGCPVFVCSVPADGLNCSLDKSHAWNLDGYLMEYTTTVREYYQNGVMFDSSTTTSDNMMVHCDFGWQGYCNGYFTSGVFDLGSNDALFDEPGHEGTKDTNYNWYLKIIQYNKPS